MLPKLLLEPLYHMLYYTELIDALLQCTTDADELSSLRYVRIFTMCVWCVAVWCVVCGVWSCHFCVSIDSPALKYVCLLKAI